MNEAQALQRTVGSEDVRGRFAVAHPEAPAGLDRAAALIALRRLQFYRDLLRLGFEGTIWPDRASRTLRSERLALGIDLPELDLVSLWAVRCGDGRVSIPFIEYLLAQTRETAIRFLPADETGAIGVRLARLDEAIATAVPGATAPGEFPRLGDVFLSEFDAVSVCGLGGVVDQLHHACEEACLSAWELS
ncbi:MAG TPA: hypothetical protein VFC25_03105 [Verrucomicrobiae bacterium]|nr:hypothetical protein [Verrucomicrobiae bacterium]